MITYYKTEGQALTTLDHPVSGCWICVEAPSDEEIRYLTEELAINHDFVSSALDENERSHTHKEEDQTLVILDMPIEEEPTTDTDLQFYTLPIGFILTPEYVVTVTSRDTDLVEDIVVGNTKNREINTAYRTHFLFAVTYHIATSFIMKLGNIDRIAFQTEREIHKSMKNQELVQLLSLEKSLVHFTTSLKSTEITLEKILRGRIIKLYEEDEELLEDTLVEIKQAIETSTIYTQVLDTTMDAVASIINNNMNVIMKVLASATIVLSIPNMVFGFYGMNVALPSHEGGFVIPIFITVLISAVSAFYLYSKGFFE